MDLPAHRLLAGSTGLPFANQIPRLIEIYRFQLILSVWCWIICKVSVEVCWTLLKLEALAHTNLSTLPKPPVS